MLFLLWVVSLVALHRLSLSLRRNWHANVFSSDGFFLPRFPLWYAVHIELQCPQYIYIWSPGAFVFSLFIPSHGTIFMPFLTLFHSHFILLSGCNITFLNIFGTLKMELFARAESRWIVNIGKFACLGTFTLNDSQVNYLEYQSMHLYGISLVS